MAKIELAIADQDIRRELAGILEKLGHEVVEAAEFEDSLRLIKEARPQVLLVQEELGGSPTEAVIGEALRLAPVLPVIVCLKSRNASRAVGYMSLGALDCVAPPWTSESVEVPLRRALRLQGTLLELIKPHPKSKIFRGIAGGVLGLILAFAGATYLIHRRHQRLLETGPISFELPYSHPSGMAFDGSRFWAGDWYSRSICTYKPEGFEIEKVYPFPSETPMALVFSEGTLWTATASGRLLKHLLDDKLTLLATFDAPGQVVGLAYDGLYLWSFEWSAGKMHKHLLDDRLSIVKSFNYPGKKPAALAYDGKALWSLDEGGGQLIKHDIDNPEVVLGRVDLGEYSGGVWQPTGLAWDGAHFWSIAERRKGVGGKVFRHRL